MLGKKVSFKKSKLPQKRFLHGELVVLEPLNILKHSQDLYECFQLDRSGDLWKYMPSGPFHNITQFKNYLKKMDCFFYAIYSKRHKKYTGVASYLRINPDIGTIEVGWITYSPLLQRTVEATEAMYLMMKNAFEDLGYRRYEWKCNNGNEASKKSALRLGFQFEGIFRQATIVKGRNRDTAWFSVIDKEWKILKKGYQKYLSKNNFDQNLQQKKKLIF
jgi:RimJ/RimL family protein N-acetyltransferase